MWMLFPCSRTDSNSPLNIQFFPRIRNLTNLTTSEVRIVFRLPVDTCASVAQTRVVLTMTSAHVELNVATVGRPFGLSDP